MAIELRKVGEGSYVLQGGDGRSLPLDQDQFEDLYYAIPEESGKYKNETEFFRHLTDNIFPDQAQRDVINAMLNAEPDKITALNAIQDQVRAIGV